MVSIKKRDGGSEDFAYEKVVVSCLKSGAPAEISREIAKNIEKEIREDMPTEEIRKRVLEALRERNREWETNWLVYDRSVKKR